jgi:type II secretory pathway pseudopilin PulG
VRERGFGLVEALIAMGLVTTALVWLAEVFGIARRASNDVRAATSEVALATQKLEELRSSGFDDAEVGEQVEDLPPFVLRTSIEAYPWEPERTVVIRVQVGTVRLVTLKTRKGL